MKTSISLLSDQQMKSFIQDGYIKLAPGYPPELHEKIYREIEQMLSKNGNLGNNILPLIPDIQKIFDHPLVRGALTGVLGVNYVMHSHRFCHFNVPGSVGQDFHKDSYEGDISANNHRCRWAMAFYYPQNTPKEIGPTAILPGSQYYETSQAAHQHNELVLSGEPGTITIIHYDLWHRAMANLSLSNRYMLKFLFYRLQEPTVPTWQNEDIKWHPTTHEKIYNSDQQIMYRSLWSWNLGDSSLQSTIDTKYDTSELVKKLSADSEEERLRSAYTLGAIGEKVIPELIDLLESKSIGAYAALALGSSNPTVVPKLISALKHSSDLVRARIASTLGDLGDYSALEHLLLALGDTAPRVRRNATESLGNISLKHGNQSLIEKQATNLGKILLDEHYWIRDNAARSLAKMGRQAEPAVVPLTCALNDENRYVRFNAALALKRIGTPKAQDILFDHLFTSRWCPMTTSDTPY